MGSGRCECEVGGGLASGGHTYTDVSRSRVLVFPDPQRDRALTLSEVRLRYWVSESRGGSRVCHLGEANPKMKFKTEGLHRSLNLKVDIFMCPRVLMV